MNLARMATIHVAIWNGYVYGSGAGMCMRAPFTIATDETSWGMPECIAGFIPDNGSSHFFSHIKGGNLPMGLYLAVTGVKVSGRDIARWGICSHYVPKENIERLKAELYNITDSNTTVDDVGSVIGKYTDNAIAHELPEHFEIV